jgi:hypothetical protein
MPNDPGLSGDTCIFMEAVSGDGGVHNANVWWLSPDITLTGPVSGPDKADPGQTNPVEIKFHRKGAESNCVFPGAESLTLELWVGNPSIAMTPSNPASTALVDTIGTPVPFEGASGSQTINWTPPAGLPNSNPQSPGHKCLIARCYPDNLTPDANKFWVPDDPHVAQRNICIVPCDGPGAANLRGPCSFQITTVNLELKEAQIVILKAVFDRSPTAFVKQTVLRSLRNFKGFKRLATRAPRRFAFELRDIPDAEINDLTRPGLLGILTGRALHYEAKVKLAAGQLIQLNFSADLSPAQPGDAFIFHLTQRGTDRRDQGGLTLVMVA